MASSTHSLQFQIKTLWYKKNFNNLKLEFLSNSNLLIFSYQNFLLKTLRFYEVGVINYDYRKLIRSEIVLVNQQYTYINIGYKYTIFKPKSTIVHPFSNIYHKFILFQIYNYYAKDLNNQELQLTLLPFHILSIKEFPRKFAYHKNFIKLTLSQTKGFSVIKLFTLLLSKIQQQINFFQFKVFLKNNLFRS